MSRCSESLSCSSPQTEGEVMRLFVLVLVMLFASVGNAQEPADLRADLSVVAPATVPIEPTAEILMQAYTGTDVALGVRSESELTSMMFTLDYDSTLASFVGFDADGSTVGWTLLNNDGSESIPSVGFNRSVRLLFFGGGFNRFAPTDGETIGYVHFDGLSPLAVNMGEHTSFVTWSPVVEFWSPDITWSAALGTVTVESRTWSTIKQLYR